WKNCVDPSTALAASPSGAKILGAQPDGTVLLYDAQVDDFVAARKDLDKLEGAYGAVSDEQFVVGGLLFNSSLVPSQVFNGSGLTSGVVVSREMAMRTTAASAENSGLVEHVNVADTGSSTAARLVEAPILPDATIVGRAFTRTLASTRDNNAYVLLSRSGLTVLPSNYDAALGSPTIDSVVNAADFKTAVAPGGLISIFGKNMSPVNAATQTTPLPTLLGDSCLSINGQLVPLVFVSPGQINGQLPFNTAGTPSMVLHTPSGVSNTLNFSVLGTAPSVFKVAVEGWGAEVPAVLRASNNQVVTLSNPVHLDDWLSLYVTGLGLVSPDVPTGAAGPADPLALADVEPEVTLGGVQLPVGYAGLAPGSVGVYQINVKVPFKDVATGMDVPLTIKQGSYETTVSVRVVR
ncbi:MAG TPA: hypothetical protein VN428_09205, partial [Bryobacteraceae bacterium]|nr:hypothetical protein [Bryobacteraceae bacterium]